MSGRGGEGIAQTGIVVVIITTMARTIIMVATMVVVIIGMVAIIGALTIVIVPIVVEVTIVGVTTVVSVILAITKEDGMEIIDEGTSKGFLHIPSSCR